MDCRGGREGGNADIGADAEGGMEEGELPVVWEVVVAVTVENEDERWEMQVNKMESVLSIIISGVFNSTMYKFAHAKRSY